MANDGGTNPSESTADFGHKQYVQVDGGQLHIRRWGHGVPVVLLHDAGASAAVWSPVVEALADWGNLCFVAPDLVGAGGTTVSQEHSGDLATHATVLQQGLQELGIDRAIFVGDGAGAAVARVCAERSPELVDSLVVWHEPAAAQSEPPAWPSADPHGAAVMSRWGEVVDGMLFRPWWERTGATRLHRPLPSAVVVNEVFLDVVDHHGAHRAFADAARAQWPNLPKAPTESAPQHTFIGLLELVKANASGSDLPEMPTTDATVEHGKYRYVDVDGLQIHIRQFGHGRPERPLLLLHSNPGSGKGLEALAEALAATRPTIVWDAPGHGRSDDLTGPRAESPTLAEIYAPTLVGLLDTLGIDVVDVYGTHTGAGLAVEFGIIAPARVGKVILDGVPLFDNNPVFVEDALQNYFLDLHADISGSHVIRAWWANVNTALWWPHYNHTMSSLRTSDAYPPALLDDMTLDMLRSAPHYARFYRSAWTWKGSERLPLLRNRALVGTTPTDPLGAMTDPSLELLPNGEKATFAPFGRADSIPVTARAIAQFLDSSEERDSE